MIDILNTNDNDYNDNNSESFNNLKRLLLIIIESFLNINNINLF